MRNNKKSKIYASPVINRIRAYNTLSGGLLFLCALLTLLFLGLIIGFILVNGLPHITWDFLTDKVRDAGREGGIYPVAVNTLYLVITTLVFSAPLSLMTAIFLTEYAKQGIFVRIIRFATENLAGIPSIIFGLFGYTFFIRGLGMRPSVLVGAITLTFVVLPIMIRSSEEAILAVPRQFKEGSLALGATRLQTVFRVVLPSASSGIFTGIILGIGRVVGETAVLIFTVGSAKDIIKWIDQPARSLAMHLYTLISEGLSPSNAYATAAVLLIIVLLLNLLVAYIGRRSRKRMGI